MTWDAKKDQQAHVKIIPCAAHKAFNQEQNTRDKESKSSGNYFLSPST